MLRFLVERDGAPTRIVPEANGQPQALVDEAIAYVQGCRFNRPASGAPPATFGRVMLKQRHD